LSALAVCQAVIDHILIAVDEKGMDVGDVAAHAAEMASALGAEVTLFRAYGQSEYEEILAGFEYESADPADIAKRHSLVRDIAEVMRDAGVNLTVAAEIGTPAEVIGDYVRKHGVDHVFIGGRRRSAAGKALLGSNSQDILRTLHVPVTVMMEE
jgi:nucleotide-binding universal stress UspA family protein